MKCVYMNTHYRIIKHDVKMKTSTRTKNITITVTDKWILVERDEGGMGVRNC